MLTKDGKIKIVIATSALSMGFDVAGVEYVIHTLMARTMEDFLQMSGKWREKNI